MWNRNDEVINGKRLGLFVGQIVVMLLCVLYIDYIYISNVLPDERVRKSFIQTTCTVVSKILNTNGGLVQGYRADFFLSYKANGADYKRWAYGNGLDDTFAQTSGRSASVLSDYEVGSTYPCYYDPSSPENVVLVLRKDWLSILPITLPMLILLTMLYFVIKTILRFLENDK